jgi:8-oxo-dGTP pyrophosphatase MutT (NUDIX family)
MQWFQALMPRSGGRHGRRGEGLRQRPLQLRELLLITSRDTGRWVIPKGWPMKRRRPWEAAAEEAFEEAGVRGEVESVQFGAYRYDKVRKSGRLRPVKVRVFRLRVVELLDDCPESEQRDRAWLSAADAAERVDEPELKALLNRVGGQDGAPNGL